MRYIRCRGDVLYSGLDENNCYMMLKNNMALIYSMDLLLNKNLFLCNILIYVTHFNIVTVNYMIQSYNEIQLSNIFVSEIKDNPSLPLFPYVCIYVCFNSRANEYVPTMDTFDWQMELFLLRLETSLETFQMER